MLYRTDSTLVSGIIEVDEDIDLDPFIEVSNMLVSEHCSSEGYSETKMEMIERWLAAHFYAIRDPRPRSEQAGDVQESFQFRIDLGLNQTRYGQMAMLLCPNLKALDKNGGVKPGAFWLGKDLDTV